MGLHSLKGFPQGGVVVSPSDQATIMVSPLCAQRLLHLVVNEGLKPNGTVSAIPKSAEKASFIVTF